MKMRYEKRAVASSLSWIVVVLVGAAILFLAIFFAGKIGDVGEFKGNIDIANYLDGVFGSFGSSGAVASVTSKEVDVPGSVLVDFDCKEIIVGTADEEAVKRHENLIFGKDAVYKEMNVFSKAFKMPFRVADLVYVYAGKVCFIGFPDEYWSVLAELNDKFVGSVEKCGRVSCCSRESEKVMFLSLEDEKVSKELVLGKIFSDSELFECNVKELGRRIVLLSQIYEKKAGYLQGREDCSYTVIKWKLVELRGIALRMEKGELVFEVLNSVASELEYLNGVLRCSHVF